MARIQASGNPITNLREALYANAYSALGAGRLPEAQRWFGLQLSISPIDSRAWTGLAACRERAVDYAAAANCYALGDQFDPRLPWCKIGEARTRIRLNERLHAERLLDKAEAQTDDHTALRAIAQLRSLL